MRILVILGTRPDALKLAPVIVALRRDRRFRLRVCATGQHDELLQGVLHFFRIRPDYSLQIMRPDQSLGELTARMTAGLLDVIAADRPDWVIVQGDTTTAFLGALAAYYSRVRTAHVEAGLRSGDKWAPFPEEMNRRLIGHLADLHFAPTPRAKENLLAEGIPARDIVVTGNTGVDTLLAIARRVLRQARPPHEVAGIAWDARRVILMTFHRRESFGEPLRRVCNAILTLARRHPDVEFLYPVHPNPNVSETVGYLLGGLPNVHLTAPLDYLSFVWCMSRAHLIITDSGGVQEEAPSLGVPVLVAREVTEREEGVAAGLSKLVGTNPRTIVHETEILLAKPRRRPGLSRRKNPYGDGRASARIAAAMAKFL